MQRVNTDTARFEGIIGETAERSSSRIAAIMNGSKKLVHDQGAYTKEPSDDNFKEANR